MSRTGDDYLESLRDGRRVYVNGERVEDVTEHPAFAEAARSIATLYDIAASPEHRDLMTFRSPTTGQPVNKAFLMPRTREDLAARRQAMVCWAEATYGIMGRSPDHVASILTGLALRADIYQRGGPEFSDARAKSRIDSSRLYIARATPGPGAWNTSCSIGADPSFGVNVIVSVPSPGNRKSVARYWSP